MFPATSQESQQIIYPLHRGTDQSTIAWTSDQLESYA